jgi:hypothetical protein
MMTLNNLSPNEMILADLLYYTSDRKALLTIIKALQPKDQYRAHAICELMIGGGDDVTNLQQAGELIEQIKRRR